MTIAIYAGSFDPITKGHLDILKSGSEIFDKVIIAVANNSDKKGLIPVEKRVELIQKSVSDIKNVEVDCYSGLTFEYAKSKGATVLLRGLRNSLDFDYEIQLAQANNTMHSDLKTVCLFTKPEFSFVSSSLVKEIFSNNGDISKFVPTPVLEYLNSIRDI